MLFSFSMIKNSENRKNMFHETDFNHAKKYFFLVLFVYTFEMMKSFQRFLLQKAEY